MRRKLLVIEGINPEPWKAPELSVERRGSRTYPRAYKNPLQAAYQEAVRESIFTAYPNLEMFPPDVQVRLAFYFWRKLDVYSLPSGRTSRRHVADATNLQKATEDALQGVLFENDRQVRIVSSEMVQQALDTEPLILVVAQEYIPAQSASYHIVDRLQRIERPLPPGNVLYVEEP